MDLELDVLASDLLFGAPEGQRLTCASLEAVLFQQPSDADICWQHQKVHGAECGCEGQASTVPLPTLNNGTAVVPAATSSFSSCSVCIDGGEMLAPDQEFDLESQGIPVKSCGDLQAFAALLEDDSPLCGALQMIGTHCGCEYVGNEACTFCADGSPVTSPDDFHDTYSELEGLPDYFKPFAGALTCGMMEASVQNYDSSIFDLSDELFCLTMQFGSGACGCSHNWKPKVITWCVLR